MKMSFDPPPDRQEIESLSRSIAYCGLICGLCDPSGECLCRNHQCRKLKSEAGCHQHDCCVRKGLSGCWECSDFPCDQDMFSPAHGSVRLHAFVRCIREEGAEKLAEYVLNNEKRGILYHRSGFSGDYDGLPDEEAVLRLLRSGRHT